MAFNMATAVAGTIDRNSPYFEDAFVHRAQMDPADDADDVDVVSISRSEYNELLKLAREYSNLRRSLIRGGVTEEAMALLSGEGLKTPGPMIEPVLSSSAAVRKISGDAGLRPDESTKKSPAIPQPRSSSQTQYHHQHHQNQNYNHNQHNHHQQPHSSAYRQTSWPDAIQSPDVASLSTDIPGNESQPSAVAATTTATATVVVPPPRLQLDRTATRSLSLVGLPEGVTYVDITNAVRGGLLLDVFLRTNVADKTATISFLYGAGAKAFYEHAKKNGLHIRNKRVDVRWAERQFIMPNHVANKIGMGATRNLVIRRCDSRLNEEKIREDMEHIHNLAIIKVEFNGGNCHVCTNSVHNALFARTCMMSRSPYKGSKIEWDADECAQPVETALAPPKARKEVRTAHRKLAVPTNRFQLLDLDDVEDEEVDSAISLQTPSRVGIQV